MRLFSVVIDGFSFDVIQLPNNPQFNELRIYGHRNQLIYSFMFQGTMAFGEPVIYDVTKHKSGTYEYYRFDVKCSVYGFSFIFLHLGNDVVKPVYTENWQEIKGTKLRVATKHDGLNIKIVCSKE